MAYSDYEDRDMDLDRGAELYDDDMYDSTETETFGETLNSSAAADSASTADDEALAADDSIAEDKAGDLGTDARLEDSFHETISDNPHIDEQLEDRQLGDKAEADYASTADADKKDESLIDKAKNKLSELTDKK